MATPAPTHRHPAADKWVHLFEGVKTFKEFEIRLSGLAGPNASGDKGAAFEVFVWAYLATSPVRQAKEVWARTDQMSEAMRAGRFPSGDKGVDGFFVTHDGLECAYQAKFHGDRSRSLTWNADKMANFIAHRGKADKLVLITNVDDDKISEEYKGSDFYAIRGRDFDELEARDFAAMHEYIVSGNIQYTPKSPRPYQTEAVTDIRQALESDDRTTAVMACGTGKTLVSLWAAEQQVPEKGVVLVMVPTLALMRQNLHEWLGNTLWGNGLGETPPSFLTVCSELGIGRTDNGRDDDGMQASIADMDFAPAKGAEEVKNFLDRPHDGVKVVISTYQSLNLVQEAIAGRDFAFDLGFFDEAHKTTGHQEKTTTLALKDEGIPIKKRLFMTATPRHYRLKAHPDDEVQLVYSMDKPEVYGPIAHNLSFRKAADKNIIAPYKVIISVIEEDPLPLDRQVLNTKDVPVERDGRQDRVNARHVALQLAIKQAAETHNLKRIITFHGETKHAGRFVSKDVTGIGGHLDGFATYHVNGMMPMSKRTQAMRAFREADKALISNARCLTEGVDVPSVDMVVFTHPKKSKVDIVQAAGRAMRKNDGKEVGYIMVPVFLQPGEDIETAIKSENFEAVWDVLKAMSEQDEMLADIIQEMSVNKGRGNKYWAGNEGLDSLIEAQFKGKALQLDDLRRAINTQIVERLGESWDEMYGLLCEVKERTGDANVPVGYKTEDGIRLGGWLSHQRDAFNAGTLSQERGGRLEALGMVWNAFDARWSVGISALRKYVAKTGNANVSSKHITSDGFALGVWLSNQRKARRIGVLSSERVQSLAELGVVWSMLDARWEEGFAEIGRHISEFGHANPLYDFKSQQGFALGAWLNVQRAQEKKGTLPQEKVERLRMVGVLFQVFDARWGLGLEALKNYVAGNGDAKVPVGYKTQEGFSLGQWLASQRSAYKAGRLAQDRLEKLEAEGVAWDHVEARWDHGLKALMDYAADHGHANVPAGYKTADGFTLGTWLAYLKQAFKSGGLTDEKIVKLEGLKVQLGGAGRWDHGLDELKRYVGEYGDAKVHQFYKAKGGFALGIWLSHQRQDYKAGRLAQDKLEKLEAEGVAWNAIETRWSDAFEMLRQFKAEYGHANAPTKYKTTEGFSLGAWLSSQRSAYKAGKLPHERSTRVRGLGCRGFGESPLSVMAENPIPTETVSADVLPRLDAIVPPKGQGALNSLFQREIPGLKVNPSASIIQRLMAKAPAPTQEHPDAPAPLRKVVSPPVTNGGPRM